MSLTRYGSSSAAAQLDSELLDDGTEVVPPRAIAGTTVPTLTGRMYGSAFVAKRSAVVNGVSFASAATAAASATLIRVGVYAERVRGAVAGNYDLIASSASDPALLAAAFNVYTTPLTAPWAKQAGTRYAIGVLQVATTSAPLIGGTVGVNAANLNLLMGLQPAAGIQVVALSDLPATFAIPSSGYALRPLFLLA